MDQDAIKWFLAEVQKGLDSAKSEEDWVSQEEAYRILGLDEAD